MRLLYPQKPNTTHRQPFQIVIFVQGCRKVRLIDYAA